jgi:deoxyribodipyrimidine photo-lyase
LRPSKFLQFSDADELPTLKTFGFDEEIEADNRSVLQFIGGETEALKRLNAYIWTQDLLKTYKETRNGLIGADYSSKFSAWLGLGCLSPRKIYEEIQKYERSRVKNQSTYWLIFELIWRDYFRFVALKFGDKIFKVEGIREENIDWKHDKVNFYKWLNGETGIPFVDANMRELKLTGFMSNRGRQNVTSFLTKDLKIDWRWGAKWFESQLVDYDVASNWGNWCYIAGVGNDPRENRYFSILKQANNYDANGEYVKLWLPELKDVPLKNLHITADLAKTYGVNYPKAIVNPEKWLRKYA